MWNTKLSVEGLESRATPSSLALMPAGMVSASGLYSTADPPIVEPGGGLAEPPLTNPDWTEEDWILFWIDFWLEFFGVPPVTGP